MSWDKTRLCACNYCRFHSEKEPGWERCPDLDKKGAKPKWLWVKNNSNAVDLEARDRQYLKEQSKNTVFENADDE